MATILAPPPTSTLSLLLICPQHHHDAPVVTASCQSRAQDHKWCRVREGDFVFSLVDHGRSLKSNSEEYSVWPLASFLSPSWEGRTRGREMLGRARRALYHLTRHYIVTALLRVHRSREGVREGWVRGAGSAFCFPLTQNLLNIRRRRGNPRTTPSQTSHS